MNPGQTSYHHKNFDALRNTADQWAKSVHANPHPNHDVLENWETYFKNLSKYAKLYCDTPGTQRVKDCNGRIQTEWPKVKQGKGDLKILERNLMQIAHDEYVAPARHDQG